MTNEEIISEFFKGKSLDTLARSVQTETNNLIKSDREYAKNTKLYTLKDVKDMIANHNVPDEYLYYADNCENLDILSYAVKTELNNKIRKERKKPLMNQKDAYNAVARVLYTIKWNEQGEM